MLKPDPDAGLTRMAEVSAAVDHESAEAGLAENRSDDVHEIALPRRADIDHEWAPRDERRCRPGRRPSTSSLSPSVRVGRIRSGAGVSEYVRS